MLHFFVRFPWLLAGPWFFGVALASFLEGRAVVWAISCCLMDGRTARVLLVAALLGWSFGLMGIPPGWRNVPLIAYVGRVERLTPRIELVASGWAEALRREGRTRFSVVLPPREAVLAAAMLYGDANFSSEDRVKVRAVGLSHLVAVSGANILFLLLMLRAVARRFLRTPRGRFFADALGILWIVVLTGGSTSVVRGGLMLVLFGGARLCGRRPAFGRILLLAAMFLVFAEPRRLLFDAGFHLSFLACIGLLHASERGQAQDLLERFSVRGSWYTWIWTAPYQLWFFGSVSWLGLLANVLVLFIVPWIQALALVVWLVPVRALAWPLRLCLSYLWVIVDRVSPFSYALRLRPGPAFILMALGYLVLIVQLIHKRTRHWSRLSSALADRSTGWMAVRLVRIAPWVPWLVDAQPELLREALTSMLEASAQDLGDERLLRTRLEDGSRSR